MRRLRLFLRGRLFPLALLLLFALLAGIVLAVRLPRLLAPVALMERAFSLLAAAITLVLEDLPERKIAKLALLCFLPWVGPILVLIFSETEKRPRTFKTAGEGGSLFSRVAATAERLKGTHVARGHIEYFSSGEEMRAALLADLKGAKRRIYLEYYIIAEGKFWGEILSLLEEKAKRGVDVRVIFDDFGCSLTLPARYAKSLASRGIKTAVFSRLRPQRGLTRRDHRKLFLIDGVCYTGGINLADEYVGERIRFGRWKDSAVRAEGDVSGFEEVFLKTWYALTRSKGTHVQPKEEAGGVPFCVLSDGTKRDGRRFPLLLPLLIASARKSICLSSPYLSLPHAAMQALFAAAASGVDVRLMIPHIPDKRLVFFLTRAYARELGEKGVKVREYAPGFLHAKSIAIDGECALVSSYNLDFRSLYVQAECGLFAEDPALAEAVERDFRTCFEEGCPLKKANPFIRALGRLAMLFAPLT